MAVEKEARVSPSHESSGIAGRLDKLYEFERAPVTPDRLHDGRYFAGLFAGEHVAATEFVIGALFVQWGAGARNLVLGLLLGNLLAVLSWAFICAPIAVRTRLTLYWYARRIIGPGLTAVYNFISGILYCCLAAAMIGVSASAVILGLSRLGLHVRHPALTDVCPNSVGWLVVVLIVGSVTTILAIAGFKRLSQFAGVCSPWMFLIFIAGAIATLPRLGDVRSLDDFWRIAETRIWLETPKAGTERLGFWHITLFAWFCNLAMHVGLSDMAIFRYARRWTYGFYSAFGMYLGHYLAWICARIMGAAVSEGLNPGEMAHLAAGLPGVLAVLLAGWTTANPTIYRAGLALQIVTPNWPRWKVTLATGAITTLVGLFPAIFMKLLNFVAIYGLVLMPIGAVIFAEHWLFPRTGLRQCWVERRGLSVNLPALIAWLTVLVLCFPIEDFTAGRLRSPMDLMGVGLFFRWLPAWFLTVSVYLLLCRLTPGARRQPDEQAEISLEARSMITGPVAVRTSAPLPPIAWISGALAVMALAACLILPMLVFIGGSDPSAYERNMGSYKTGLMVATVAYFIGGIIWMVQREKARLT